MSEAESTQQPKPRTAHIWSMPNIEIPADFELHDYGYLTFPIETCEGLVRVYAAYRHFHCKGTYAALAACGLLQADWLPGIPGNNKTIQRVGFENERPYLLKGKCGSRVVVPHISILRKSRISYEVCVRMTQEQEFFIQELFDKREKEREIEQETERVKKADDYYKKQTPEEFKRPYLGYLDMLNSAAEAGGGAFSYDDEALARINQACNTLRNAFADGKLVRRGKLELHREGNVIFLGSHREIEVTQ